MNNPDRSAHPTNNGQLGSPDYSGITKLEYFTAAALTGLLANSFNGNSQPLSIANAREIAEIAVDQAVAVLRRLGEIQ